MHRFFVDPAQMAGERFALPAAIAHQVTRVLRLQSGERLVLLDGEGGQATCRLDGGACIVEERGPAGGEPRYRLTVWQALLRGDHLEPIVRHATEVGVAAFGLMLTERCVARSLSPGRLDRLQAVAREAAEQSERGRVPSVAAPVSFRAAVASAPSASVLLYERDADTGLAALAHDELPPAILIGPEGGFAPGELEVARTAGVRIGGLGPRILRSESVAVAAAAVILSVAGDFA